MQKAYTNLINIQVTNSNMSFNAPVCLLAEIPHNTDSELVVGNMNCFPIVTSYDCRRPPSHVLHEGQ